MSDQTAVEEWLNAMEDTRLSGWDPERGVYRCDFCSGTVHALKRGKYTDDRRITHYVSDKILEPDGIKNPPGLSVLRSYCAECNRTRVQFPCQGFNEIMLSSYLRPDGAYTDWEIEDFSGANDGVPWDPREFFNSISEAIDLPMTFKDWAIMGKLKTAEEDAGGQTDPFQISQGPEDVIDHFLILDIDPREIVDEDGDVQISDEQAEELTEKIDERVEELSHTIGDEKAFHRQMDAER